MRSDLLPIFPTKTSFSETSPQRFAISVVNLVSVLNLLSVMFLVQKGPLGSSFSGLQTISRQLTDLVGSMVRRAPRLTSLTFRAQTP